MNVQRAIDAAKAAALATAGIRANRVKIGAALYVKNRLVSVGGNSYKTHPKVLSYQPYPHLHAEQQAILRAGLDNCFGGTLTVFRVKRDGSIGLAKPCEACFQLARDVGIRTIYYTTDDGSVQHINLREGSIH